MKQWPRAVLHRLGPDTIRGRLTFWFLLLSFIPIVAIGAIAYQSSRSSLEQQIASKLDSLAENKVFFLRDHIGRQLSDVKRLSSNAAVKGLLSPAFVAKFPNLAE